MLHRKLGLLLKGTGAHMRKRRNGLWLFCITLCVSAGTVVTALHSRSANQDPKPKPTPQHAEEVDTTKFPIVDFAAPLPADPKERAKRVAKSKKYNRRHAQPIDESIDRTYLMYDWDVGLPALPIAESAAVIIGEITDVQAHLSEDKTTVYSEFGVRVESILKDDGKIPLTVAGLVSVQRLGGRVRWPSGKVVAFPVYGQDLPTPNGRYVLFLTHASGMRGVWDDTLFILTGYELRGGKVLPLDKLRPGHPIMKYKEADESSLLKDLESALANL